MGATAASVSGYSASVPRSYAHDGDLPLKRCSRCGEYKTLGGFNRSKSAHSPDGEREYHCRSCRAAYSLEYRARNRERMEVAATAWVKANPERVRDGVRRRNYGMPPGLYREILAAQNGVCAVCGGTNSSGRLLAVDHDHTCCAVPPCCGACNRGLLCSRCNTGLGSFGDDPTLLLEAAAYLEAHGKRIK